MCNVQCAIRAIAGLGIAHCSLLIFHFGDAASTGLVSISFPLTLTLPMNQCEMSNVQCAMCNMCNMCNRRIGHCSLLIAHFPFGAAARTGSGVQCAKSFGEFSPRGEGTRITSDNRSTHIAWLNFRRQSGSKLAALQTLARSYTSSRVHDSNARSNRRACS
jgi:hypothetical protein